jgi:hypothetical protein
MAGNIHKLTVGNYINHQYGIITGLTYDIMEESPWEITTDNQLPMYIKVTGFQFIPIHDFRPEYKTGDSPNFIYQNAATKKSGAGSGNSGNNNNGNSNSGGTKLNPNNTYLLPNTLTTTPSTPLNQPLNKNTKSKSKIVPKANKFGGFGGGGFGGGGAGISF